MYIWQVRKEGYPHTQAFDTVALCLRESIHDMGFESKIVHTPDIKRNHIVLGAHLLSSVPAGCIIYNLEQITPESFTLTDTYIEILKKNCVWDYSLRNIEELKKLGIDAVHMPIGYHKILTRNWDMRAQNIDCLFYGSINPRRKKITDSLNAKVLYNIYGETLDKYIAHSKIVLNCHFYETKLFEIVRCSYLLANRKFILSERGNDHYLEAPFREGIGFHDAEEMPYWYSLYMGRPYIRDNIAQAGFEIFSNMTQVGFLENESKSW